MKRLPTGIRYAFFALLATIVNIAIQKLSLELWKGSFSLYGAILFGTAAGLALKYMLDKRFIFQYKPQSFREDTGTFLLYLLMSGITTAVFWSVELSFHSLFAFPNAKYIGAATGLVIGYSAKYVLDKRFVFPKTGESKATAATAKPVTVDIRVFQSGLYTPLSLYVKKYMHRFFFVIPCLFYFYTACRTPGWGDAAMIASNTVHLVLGSWVNTHNLFHLLGFLWLKLFPSANVHFHLVLLSALFGALTVHFMFLTGRELTSRPVAAAIGAVALMVSHSLWWHSTMLEVYTLNTALLSLMLYFVVRYEKTTKLGYLCLAAFFFGLGCSNHVLMGLFVFAFVLVVLLLLIHRKILTVRHLFLLLACFLLGFQLYLIVFVKDFLRSLPSDATTGNQGVPETVWNAFREVLHKATGGDFKRYMFSKDMPMERILFYRFSYGFWIVYNFASPALLLGFWGFYLFWKKRAFRLSCWFFFAGFAAQVVWSANYFIWDMYAFSLPVFVLFSLPVMLAIDRLIARKGLVRRTALALSFTVLLPVLLYSQVPYWYRQGGFFRWYFDSYPETQWVRHTWEPAEYFGNPYKRNYDKVERYINKLHSVLPQQAHLLDSDCRADYALRYYYRDVQGVRTDIVHHALFSPFLTPEKGKNVARELKDQLDSGKPVYTVSVLFPEKVVLDQLYLLYDPGRESAYLESLSLSEYLSSFPGVRFEKIMLFEEEEIWIYKMRLTSQKIDSQR